MLQNRWNFGRKSLRLEWTGLGNAEIISIAKRAMKYSPYVTYLNNETYLEIDDFIIPVVISENTDRYSLVVSSFTSEDISGRFRAVSKYYYDIDDVRSEFNDAMEDEYDPTTDFSISLDITDEESYDVSRGKIEKAVDSIVKQLVLRMRKVLTSLLASITESRMNCLRRYKKESDDDSVIVKVGNKWRIKGDKVKYWNAEYDTREKALSALRAYHAKNRRA